MKQTKSRKLLAVLLTLMISLSLLPLSAVTVSAAPATYEFWDLRNADNITTEELTGTVNGSPLDVTRYTGYYVPEYLPGPGDTRYGEPNNSQKINIFVPDNATPDTGILLLLQNGGWSTNTFSTATTITDGFSYVNTSPTNNQNSSVGLALERGMVVVSYGCRTRNPVPGQTDNFTGHSPATMTDTKAAIRFLRYNYYVDGGLLQGYGNPNYIFVTGSSGGGALSVILAASGNSPDYYDSLYEIGAAGIKSDGAGGYIDTLQGGDSLFGTMAYCPITDLPMADQAYEFTYNTSRTMRTAHPEENGNLAPLATNPVMLASNWLANDFAGYINGLGLEDENGITLDASFTEPTPGNLAGTTSGTFQNAMIRLLERGIVKAIDEWATGYNVRSNANAVDGLDIFGSWLLINGAAPTSGNPAQGSRATITSLNDFLTEVPGVPAVGTSDPARTLKIAPAFDNMGIKNAGGQNENNLVGTIDQAYSHWHEYTWNEADGSVAGVGFDNTGLTWDDFLQTDDGALVALQAKMTTPIPYLLGAENIPYLQYTPGSDDCDVAPYWYVRHGEGDRDTSFAVGTLLYYSLLANSEVNNDLLNFNFAWQKPHGGYYDLLEAYDWLDSVMAEQVSTGTTADGTNYTMYYNLAYGKVDEGIADGPTDISDQKLDVYIPDGVAPAGGWPVVVYVHGGGAVRGSKNEDGPSLKYAKMALDNGFAMVSINYRLPGGGSISSVAVDRSAAQVADVRAALRFVDANAGVYGINKDLIALLGPSAGGGLVSYVGVSANQPGNEKEVQPCAVLGFAAAISGGGFPDLYNVIDANDPPYYLPHGSSDTNVTYNTTTIPFARALTLAGVPTVYQSVVGAEHTIITNNPTLYEGLDGIGKLNEPYEWLKDIIAETWTKPKTAGGTTYNKFSDIPYNLTSGRPEVFVAPVNSVNINVLFQALDIYLPDGPAPAGGWPVVVYVHGGGYTGGDKAEIGASMDFAQKALDNGFAMVSVNYRLPNNSSNSTGIGPELPNGVQASTAQVRAMIDDVQDALQYLYDNASDWRLNRNLIALLGPSAGGSLITYAALAANNEPNKVKVMAAIGISAGLSSIINPSDATLAFLEPIIDENDPPFYLASGTDDSVVLNGAVTQAFWDLLVAVGRDTGSIFELVKDAQHTFAYQPNNIYKMLNDLGKLNDAFVWLRAMAYPPQTGYPGGGTTAAPKVDVGKPANGNITVSNPNPAVGDKVIVTVKPNTGYKLDSLKITDKDGKAVAYTDNGDGTFTFTYEGSEVTIEAIFVPLAAAPEIPFLDVKSTDWFYDYVKYVYDHGLMIGTSEDEFSPNLTSSRAMIVTVLWRMAGSPATSGTNSFTDLTADWYKDAVQWAVSNGITNGMSATSFGPNAPVTREQLATFLYRFADFMGYDISKKNDLAGYTDSDKISDFAKDAMEWINAMGVITGENDTTLNPKGASTRAVLATVLARFCEAYNVFGDAEVKPDAEVEEEVEDEEEVEEEEEVVDEEEVADEDEVDEAA